MTQKEPTTNVIGSILVSLGVARRPTCHRHVGNKLFKSLLRKKEPTADAIGSFLAEKEGFEPSIPFWGIHDFQSCALGQLRDFSMFRPLLQPARVYYSIYLNLSRLFFTNFYLYFHPIYTIELPRSRWYNLFSKF